MVRSVERNETELYLHVELLLSSSSRDISSTFYLLTI